MSWPRAAFRRATGPLLAALLLAGCGFQPLYADRDGDPGMAKALASVRVQQAAERQGQELTTQLRDAFNPHALTVPAAYMLQVSLAQTVGDAAIRENGTASRNVTNLSANWTLKRLSDGKVVAQGHVHSITSHDVLANEYANVVSGLQDRDHAVLDVGTQIQYKVAAYLQNPT